MQGTLMKASNEWWSRPDDERYTSVYDLHDAVLNRRKKSKVEVLDVAGMEVTGKLVGDTLEDGIKDISLAVPNSLNNWTELRPTNWSFGQLCQKAEAPVTYMRKLHPELAAYNLNYGLKVLSKTELSKLMVVQDDSLEVQKLHCITGKDYGRIWDSQVAKLLIMLHELGWEIPAASYSTKDPLRATTLYASDRDIFGFMVKPADSHALVVRDKYGKEHALNQGIMVWNSEVGNLTFGASWFNYDYVCDNRIVWGVSNLQEFKFKHSKYAPERFDDEARPMIRQYAEATPEDHSRVFQAAMEIEVGKDEKEVMSWLKGKGFNSAEQKRIISQGRSDRGGELPNTVWEIVSAGTAAARAIPNTDNRLAFERKSSSLLDVAERKVKYVNA